MDITLCIHKDKLHALEQQFDDDRLKIGDPDAGGYQLVMLTIYGSIDVQKIYAAGSVGVLDELIPSPKTPQSWKSQPKEY